MYKVRMANMISENAAMLIKLVLQWRPKVFIVAEQPKGSFMFKMPYWKDILKNNFFSIVLTYLGLWGLDILKATHLATNMESLAGVCIVFISF